MLENITDHEMTEVRVKSSTYLKTGKLPEIGRQSDGKNSLTLIIRKREGPLKQKNCCVHLSNESSENSF